MQTPSLQNPQKLSEMVSYRSESIVSREVIKSDCGNITLFAFAKNQGLSDHASPYTALIQVIEGKSQVTINEKKFQLQAGEVIILPANIPHAVLALSNLKLMLTMIK